MKPSPHAARLGMAISALVGLFASVYLFYTYVTGVPIVCGIVSGCELVRASRWAYTLGVPRPLLGMIFYVLVFATLVMRVSIKTRSRELWLLTRALVVLGCVESAFLFFVQWLDVRAFCVWCLTSAAAAIALTLFAIFDRPPSSTDAFVDRELRAYLVCLMIFVPIALFGFFWLTRIAHR